MDERLFEIARAAMANAHAPYSGFHVGAAVRAGDPEGCCAEAAAIAAMVLDGARKIEEVVVVSGGGDPATPCGGCRQRIREFAGPRTPIHVCGPDGVQRTFTLGELLPESFGPENLG